MTDRPTWRIYYEDGSTWSDLDGDEYDAPPVGVVCIVQPCPVRDRVIITGWNWYYFCAEPDARWRWWGSNESGMHDQFMWHGRHRRALKMGRHAQDYEEILIRAAKDPDFAIPSEGATHSPTALWGD